MDGQKKKPISIGHKERGPRKKYDVDKVERARGDQFISQIG